jgi:hypothetical protein
VALLGVWKISLTVGDFTGAHEGMRRRIQDRLAVHPVEYFHQRERSVTMVPLPCSAKRAATSAGSQFEIGRRISAMG